jgi:hypothetical protein
MTTKTPRIIRASCTLTLAVAALLVPAESARAQGIQSAVDGPQEGEEIKGDTGVAEIREVERGFYTSVDLGLNHYIPLGGGGFVQIGEPLFSDPANPATWASPGTRMGMRVGYDILNNINAEGFLLANFNQGVIDNDVVASGEITGDLTNMAVGVGGRFAFITTERLFVFARGGVGYALWFPQQLAQNNIGSIHLDTSVGLEYYTALRHLSVGVEADFQALILPMAFGFSVYPTIKYTF